MDFIKKNKAAIISILAVGLLVWVYMTYFQGSSATLTATAPDTTVSSSLLVTLGSINTIKLDNRIFSDPVFVSLSNFGVTIPTPQPGRADPFAPPGQGTSPAATSSAATPTQ